MFGNLGQLASLMKDFQDVKRKIGALKDELAAMELSASDPNGIATIVVSGDLVVKSLTFKQGADAATLSPAAVAAMNQALAEIKKAFAAKLSDAAGGLPLSSLL